MGTQGGERLTSGTLSPARPAGPGAGASALRRRPGLLRPFALVPFFAFVALFLLIPAGDVVVQAFRSDGGGFTLSNVGRLFDAANRGAFEESIKISAITAVLAGLIGMFVAQAALRPEAPKWIRPLLTTFSGVASNFAGVPLAFAFIATLGSTGIVTKLLSSLGFHLYGGGFTIYGLVGLSLTYLYFQLPLMILVIAPAIDGIRPAWREAAENLGASRTQFWLHVGLPVMLPSLLGAMVLLFANAFSAYATPYALSGGYIDVVPVVIGRVLSGNLISDPHLGDALAFGMIVVIAVAAAIYYLLQRRAAKWLR